MSDTTLASAANRAAVLAAGLRRVQSHAIVGPDYIGLSPDIYALPSKGEAGIPLVPGIAATVHVGMRSVLGRRTVWLCIDSYAGGTQASPGLVTGSLSITMSGGSAAAFTASSSTVAECLEGWRAAIAEEYPDADVSIVRTRLDRAIDDTIQIVGAPEITALVAPEACALAVLREVDSAEVDLYARIRREVTANAAARRTPAASELGAGWVRILDIGVVLARGYAADIDVSPYSAARFYADPSDVVVTENLATPVTSGPGVYRIVNVLSCTILQSIGG